MNDLIPDECSEYWDTNLQFQDVIRDLRVTHQWCPESREMQPMSYFREQLDKEIERLYTDLGGSD